ncbi:MAG: 50S ribosomal protein L25 [Chthoniobacterales bacterium]
MSQQLKLAAQNRTVSGRNAVKKVKAAGFVPAVIYGDKNAPQNLQIATRDLNALMAHASSENILVDLEISDGPNKVSRLALIHEIQHHPVGRHVLHVDFQAVSATETLTASVPVEPVGESNGVKNFGGLLSQNLHEIELECLPKDLPESIQVDVSALNVGDSIHVRDIVLPAGVVTTLDGDLTVFAVAEALVAEEPVAAAAAAPEVLKEKKPADAPAAAAAPAKK